LTALRFPRGRLGRGLLAAVVLLAVAWAIVWWVGEHHEADQRFHTVRRGVLYRSRQPEAENFSGVARRNIVQVVNLRSELEDKEAFTRIQAACKAQGVSMVNIPISTVVPDEEQIQRFLQAVKDCKGATLVHCAQGRSRTGIMIAAYRVVMEGWTAQAAYDEMIRFGDNPKGEEHTIRLALLNRLSRDRGQWLERIQAPSTQP